MSSNRSTCYHANMMYGYPFRSDLLLNAQVSPEEVNAYIEKDPMEVCVVCVVLNASIDV